MYFSEEIFLWALMRRPEDAKKFSQIFKPQWLKTAQYRPILAEIYQFTKDKGLPPNTKVLREIFKDKDPAQYEARYSKVLDEIDSIDPAPETPEMIYMLDKAKDVAISWSLKEFLQSQAFQRMNEEFDGVGQIKFMSNWIKQFSGASENVELDIREAVDYTKDLRGFNRREVRIPSGIAAIDRLSGGGLRPKNLGIILAPTGGGKSTCLMILAYKIAAIEELNVLFITNELSMEEVTERFMSSITGERLDNIVEDPVVGYAGLERHWKMGLHNRLRLVDVKAREITSDEIESIVGRYINLYGWAPDVVVIDYMERMMPTLSGYKRDQSWNWYGAISKDLVRLAKANNWLIWTAGQINRSGMDGKHVMTGSMAQGSIQHLQEAAAVIGVRQLESLACDDEDTTILEFQSMKMRQNKKLASSIMVEARMGVMEISDRVRKIDEFTKETDS
ncbi:MAG: DnaB-like helicase C-terminal domain-containing protein [Candidatus Thorarchaeota archaeon]|jgi:replicative DNA helicase